MKQKFTLLFAILFSVLIFPQVETVPAEHEVYPFLKKMQVQGIIKNYNDVILPLSKEKIVLLLNEIDSMSYNLSSAEKEFFFRMKERFNPAEPGVNLFEDFPDSLKDNIFKDRRKNFYSYNDSLVSFYINPILEYSFIYSGKDEASASLLNPGGKAYGSYDNWLGFYIQGTNGIQFGSRDVAHYDPAVEQSFTFNHTGINFYDGTRGYLRLQKGMVSLQLGRERILWGTGYINKMLLSDNPPLFDFIKFDIGYKSLSYNFIHGWLVSEPETIFIDSLAGNLRRANPKYFAISRLSFAPANYLLLGISQVIVYSNRPFEAAYLNPFLFWESAQRSMNDMDNSLLAVDGRYLVTNGVEISASAIFDDLDFSALSEGESIDNSNGSAWQAGVFLTSPILPEDLSFKVEYLQIRPYMFSHKGITRDALTYTHNGYILGTGIHPNSVLFSAEIDYRFSGKLNLNLKYSQHLHGSNTYDAQGNLITNAGGNIYNNFSWYNDLTPALLDGIRERTDEVLFFLNYELTYGFYFNFSYRYLRENLISGKNDNNILRAGFRMDFE